MHQYTHNLIRRAQSDFWRYGVIALDTAALLNEAGIDIETLEQDMLTLVST